MTSITLGDDALFKFKCIAKFSPVFIIINTVGIQALQYFKYVRPLLCCLALSN